MAANKTYWKNTEQLKENSPMVDQLEQKEFAEFIPVNEFLEDKEALEESSTSRRDFLKYVGFSTAAASLAACEGPVIKSVPYVVQPEQIRPGVANYYATAIADGFDFGSILIKTRKVVLSKLKTILMLLYWEEQMLVFTLRFYRCMILSVYKGLKEMEQILVGKIYTFK